MNPFKINLAVCAGNTIEWCDFTIYPQLSVIIAPQFFPTHSTRHSLILFFLTYFITYAVRPIGGLTLARIAAKFGRRKMLLISAGLMSGCTICIALLPTYQTLGWAAALLLIILRLIQALAISVEFPTAITYQIERTTNQKRLIASFVQSSVFSGVVLASLIVAFLSRAIPDQSMIEWGWRVPFLVLGGLGFGLLALRLRLPETKEFEQSNELTSSSQTKLLANKKIIFYAFLVPAASALGTGFFAYQVTYLTTFIHQSLYKVTLINVLVDILIIIFIPISTLLLAKWPIKQLLKINLYILMLFSVPLFNAMQGSSVLWITVAECIFALLLAPFISTNVTYMTSFFSVKQRVHNVTFTYNLSFAIFGSSIPLVALMLKNTDFFPWTLGVYFIAICLLSLIGITYIQRVE